MESFFQKKIDSIREQNKGGKLGSSLLENLMTMKTSNGEGIEDDEIIREALTLICALIPKVLGSAITALLGELYGDENDKNFMENLEKECYEIYEDENSRQSPKEFLRKKYLLAVIIITQLNCKIFLKFFKNFIPFF